MAAEGNARSRLLVAIALIVVSCGGETSSSESVASESAASNSAAAGGCAAGSARSEGGLCPPSAGVPPEACGRGFEAADGECSPILPPRPCEKGLIALPGEAECRPVSACGSGRWGDIPVDETTQYVDASYGGTDSNGSADRPWRAIQPAIDAAAPGAIVAVAQGTYTGDVVINSKLVRVWGRCPELVEIVGDGVYLGAVGIVYPEAAGSEIHALAVTGPQWGLAISTTDVLIDRVWVHDTLADGLAIANAITTASAVVTGSLFESTRSIGIDILGASVVVEDSVVRDTRFLDDGTFGRGVSVQHDTDTSTGASLTLKNVVVERNHEIGVFVNGAEATIEASLIRDTQSRPTDGLEGRGLTAQNDIASGTRARVTLDASVLERNVELGLFVLGSDAELTATTIRDTVSAPGSGVRGRGLSAQRSLESADEASVSVTDSTVARSHEGAIVVLGSSATIDRVLVRNVDPIPDGSFGDGVAVASFGTGGDSFATITNSRIEHCVRAGVSAFGGTVRLASSMLLCNAIPLDEEVEDVPGVFEDLGGNVCSCNDSPSSCVVLSSTLAPPAAIDP